MGLNRTPKYLEFLVKKVEMERKPILTELFTIPQAACNSGKANWIQTGEMIKNLINTRFGSAVEFNHIEFMSGQWFQNSKAQEMLENGNVNFPFVLVDGEIACSEKKINISKIINTIQLKIK